MGGGGGGALESRVDFGGVGGGGWHKRKNLQISDVQRLASLEGYGLESQVMLVELANYIVLLRENILVVLGLNPSDSNVSYGILPCTC